MAPGALLSSSSRECMKKDAGIGGVGSSRLVCLRRRRLDSEWQWLLLRRSLRGTR